MDFKDILAKQLTSNESFVLVTVVATSGSVPGKVGFKMMVTLDEKVFGTVGGGAIEQEAKKHALGLLKRGKSEMKEYILSEKPLEQEPEATQIRMMCSGRVTMYYDVMLAKPSIYIFGAGHVGEALIHFLSKLDMHVVVVDNREGFAGECTNHPVGESVLMDYVEFTKTLTPPDNSYFVILSQKHIYDYDIAKVIYERKLDQKAAYIGIISSKAKAKQIKEKLSQDLEITDLEKLHTPIGLMLGGNTAEEIALCIVAQIQSIRYGKKVTIE